jgi:hypothetical protein
MICFQVGSDDALQLSRQLSKHEGQVKLEDLTNLPKYHAYCRLLIDGMPSQPFSMKTIAPDAIEEDRSAIVREQSRRQFSRLRSTVNEEMEREFEFAA